MLTEIENKTRETLEDYGFQELMQELSKTDLNILN